MAHTETIKKVGNVEVVEGEDGFVWAHVEVVTMGNVRKVVRFPHVYAAALKTQLENTICDMEDQEHAKRSWAACVAWIKRGWK